MPPKLEKAIFHNKDTGTDIKVLFNPAELAFKKSVPWKAQKRRGKNVPKQQFTAGDPRTMSIKLDYDTSGFGGSAPEAPDVRPFIAPLIGLAHVASGKREPPTIDFSWGAGEAMTCVVKSINVTYTRFNPDGIPTRCKVQMELIEVAEAEWSSDAAAIPPENETTREARLAAGKAGAGGGGGA